MHQIAVDDLTVTIDYGSSKHYLEGTNVREGSQGLEEGAGVECANEMKYSSRSRKTAKF